MRGRESSRVPGLKVEQDEPTLRAVAAALASAIDEAASSAGPLTILYSGGLDSSVIAWCLRPRRPTLCTVGVAGSADLLAARSGAARLGLQHVARNVDRTMVKHTLDRWAGELTGLREPHLSVAVSLALAIEAAPAGRLVCGQGADELFLGYAHFRGLSPAAAAERAAADWSRLIDHDWPRTQRIANALGHELRSPYFDPGLREAVRACRSPLLETPPALAKPVLRGTARLLGVPEELLARPKKAMQYGSGIARLVREVEREAGAGPWG